MGGGGKRVLENFATVSGLSSIVGAAGGVALNESKDVQNTLDASGLNPQTTTTKLENEGKAAKSEQAKREADIIAADEQANYAKKNTAKRNRQKSLMGSTGGRSGTILTSGLGEPAAVGGKTLLGS